jgi:hypothetical protein
VLAFLRSGKLRHAEWTGFDFDWEEWRIPGRVLARPFKPIAARVMIFGNYAG